MLLLIVCGTSLPRDSSDCHQEYYSIICLSPFSSILVRGASIFCPGKIAQAEMSATELVPTYKLVTCVVLIMPGFIGSVRLEDTHKDLDMHLNPRVFRIEGISGTGH